MPQNNVLENINGKITVMPISINQRYHNVDQLRPLLKILSEKEVKLHITIADTLKTFTYLLKDIWTLLSNNLDATCEIERNEHQDITCIIVKIPGEENSPFYVSAQRNKTIADGIKWKNQQYKIAKKTDGKHIKVTPFVLPFPSVQQSSAVIQTSMSTWSQWLAHPNYCHYRQKIENTLIKNEKFAEVFEMFLDEVLHERFINNTFATVEERQKNKDIINNFLSFGRQLEKEYLLQETTVFAIWMEVFQLCIYPRQINPIMQYMLNSPKEFVNNCILTFEQIDVSSHSPRKETFVEKKNYSVYPVFSESLIIGSSSAPNFFKPVVPESVNDKESVNLEKAKLIYNMSVALDILSLTPLNLEQTVNVMEAYLKEQHSQNNSPTNSPPSFLSKGSP